MERVKSFFFYGIMRKKKGGFYDTCRMWTNGDWKDKTKC